MPPDVRWRLCPTGSSALNHFGATPLQRGAAPDSIRTCRRAQPFRTSGGKAANAFSRSRLIKMKKFSSLSFASILVLASFALLSYGQEGGVGGSAFHKNDITYSTEIVTAHGNWATTLPGGPIKSFFIPS